LRLLIAMDVVRTFPDRVARRPERYAMPKEKSVADVKAELESVLASELAARLAANLKQRRDIGRLFSGHGIARLLRYSEPLRHPRAPSLSLAGVRLVIADHALGLPVFRLAAASTTLHGALSSNH
jgi:hypothetical protein